MTLRRDRTGELRRASHIAHSGERGPPSRGRAHRTRLRAGRRTAPAENEQQKRRAARRGEHGAWERLVACGAARVHRISRRRRDRDLRALVEHAQANTRDDRSGVRHELPRLPRSLADVHATVGPPSRAVALAWASLRMRNRVVASHCERAPRPARSRSGGCRSGLASGASRAGVRPSPGRCPTPGCESRA